MSNPSAKNLFVRIDRSNRPIDSTNKLLLKAPRQGRWLKVDSITGNVCCDYVTIEATPDSTDATGIIVTIFCDGVKQEEVTVSGTFADINELVTLLNAQASILGTFSTDGTTISLKTPRNTVSCDGTLSMTLGDITTIVATPAASSGTDWVFTLTCGETNIISQFIAGTAADLDALATLLNGSLSWLGVFSVATTTIVLTIPSQAATSLCSTDLTMTIVLD